MNLQDFYSKSEIVKSWNNTIKSKAIVLYPKNISQLKRLIIILKKKNKNYLIRTGSCSYDSKSINPDIKTFIISLRNLNKVLKINKNKKFIEVEAGALIADVIKSIKNKYLTLFSVPGGNKITIGGAISANTIGKDSSATIPSFGDSFDVTRFWMSKSMFPPRRKGRCRNASATRMLPLVSEQDSFSSRSRRDISIGPTKRPLSIRRAPRMLGRIQTRRVALRRCADIATRRSLSENASGGPLREPGAPPAHRSVCAPPSLRRDTTTEVSGRAIRPRAQRYSYNRRRVVRAPANVDRPQCRCHRTKLEPHALPTAVRIRPLVWPFRKDA